MKKIIPVFIALLITAPRFSATAQMQSNLSRQPTAAERQPASPQPAVAHKNPIPVKDDEANARRETQYQAKALALTADQEQKVYGVDLAFLKKLSERRATGILLSSNEHMQMVAEKERQLKGILTATQYAELTNSKQASNTGSSAHYTSSNK